MEATINLKHEVVVTMTPGEAEWLARILRHRAHEAQRNPTGDEDRSFINACGRAALRLNVAAHKAQINAA